MASGTSDLKFSEGEKVLCFHGPLLYEAKCIKSQIEDKEAKYLIHYNGWNKKWDQWVPESHMLKHNDINLKKQIELQGKHLKSKPKPRKLPKKDAAEKEKASTSSLEKPQANSTATTSSETDNADTQKKKRAHFEQNVEAIPDPAPVHGEGCAKGTDYKLELPGELKKWLVHDWNFITHQKKLVHLPARITVKDILGEFVKYNRAEKGATLNQETVIREVTNGISDYFNIMLGNQLLYNLEHSQYEDLLSKYPEMPMSEIYGAVHLARLLVKFGAALSYSTFDQETAELVMPHLQEFIKFMSQPSRNFLSFDDYEITSE